MSGAVRLNPLPDPSTYGPNAEKKISPESTRRALFLANIFPPIFYSFFKKVKKTV